MSLDVTAPLTPWPREQCIALLRGQRQQRKRSYAPTDLAAVIAVASRGWLTPGEVRTIRARANRGIEPIDVIGDDYDLGAGQVLSIQQGFWVPKREAA